MAPGPGWQRNRSARVVFLVTGASKAEALQRAIAGDRDIPASCVRTEGEFYWVEDTAAGRLLGGAR
ncbi:MAG: 6-phosphogluconolactonase [Longimicrobiales bacterium]